MASPPSQSTSQPRQSALSLPEGLSADSIDTLPVLSAVLSRLQNLSPHTAATTTTSASSLAGSPSQIASSTGVLTIKDIPAATDELKHKLQKARVQVNQLPDMQRSVAEQEEEIRELEERIRAQRAVLEKLRDVGVAAKTARLERDGKGELVVDDAMET